MEYVNKDIAFEAKTARSVPFLGGNLRRAATGRLTPIADRIMLLIGDFGALALAQIFAAMIAFGFSEQILDRQYEAFEAGELSDRLIRIALLITVPVLWWFAKGHYSRRAPFWSQTREVVKAITLVALLDGFLLYITRDDFSRMWLMQAWLWALLFVPVARISMRRLLKNYGSWTAPVLVVGNNETADEAADVLESEPYLGYEIAGVVSPESFSSENAADLPSSFLYRAGGDLGHALAIALEQYQARFIVLAPSPEEMGTLDPILRALHRAHISFAVIPPVRGMGVMALETGNFFSHDLVMLTQADNLNRPLSRILKRSFDMALAGLALLLLAPFFAVVAALIRQDGGPAFFGHRRVGENGREFHCLKFRTMKVNGDQILAELLASDKEAAAEWARDQKLQNDPRVTPIGHFLRRTSLDELPQLINVLRNEMSLVGPRPVTYGEVIRYGEDAEYYLAAKPGITGLWQVSGRNQTTYLRRVQLDAWYVKNWSLWQDIAILCKTLPALITRHGAC
ncbi:MAG: undecaprenyl-phosphate galactose phosphotransferase WbaP [Rhizobiales bacterium]|nr:undecaprenyl-phosphate galactose phosphotransferase WbaP [Hyphomicrobiales bacterium]